jgi:hypothetical protein
MVASDGETGHQILNDRVHKLHAVENYLGSKHGIGIQVYDLEAKFTPHLQVFHKDNHHRGVSRLDHAGQRLPIESYEVSNLIWTYDWPSHAIRNCCGLFRNLNTALILPAGKPHADRQWKTWHHRLCAPSGACLASAEYNLGCRNLSIPP